MSTNAAEFCAGGVLQPTTLTLVAKRLLIGLIASQVLCAWLALRVDLAGVRFTGNSCIISARDATIACSVGDGLPDGYSVYLVSQFAGATSASPRSESWNQHVSECRRPHPWSFVSIPETCDRRLDFYVVAGWPMKSNYGRYSIVFPLTDASRIETDGLLRFSASTPLATRANIMPIYPVWPGIIANSAIFALLVGAIIHLWQLMVRVARIRGNRCHRCGYPSAGLQSAVCSECGSLRRRR